MHKPQRHNIMEKTKHLIFDFDGTLADTAPEIVVVTRATIRELGLAEKTEAECRSMIGVKMEEIGPMFWPGIPGLGQLFADTYRRIAAATRRGMTASLFPGVSETLTALRRDGYDLAVASSRSRVSLTDYLDHLAIRDLFVQIVGGDDVPRAKPAPDAVLRLCRDRGWEPGACLMVGDAVVDIQMGASAGARTCAAAYGNQPRETLLTASPTYVIAAFTDLAALLADSAAEPQR